MWSKQKRITIQKLSRIWLLTLSPLLNYSSKSPLPLIWIITIGIKPSSPNLINVFLQSVLHPGVRVTALNCKSDHVTPLLKLRDKGKCFRRPCGFWTTALPLISLTFSSAHPLLISAIGAFLIFWDVWFAAFPWLSDFALAIPLSAVVLRDSA